MIYELQKSVQNIEVGNLFCKTPRLNNPKTTVLTHNRFNTYLVLNFKDLIKAQIYKMPYRDSPHHEIENLVGFNLMNLLKPNGHREDYQKANDENLLFEIGDKKYLYVGEKLVSFETNEKISK